MVTLAEYFALHRYQGKYELGARVFGKWNKIPFVGTVGTDSVVSEKEGPRLVIQTDLPILYEDKWHTIITVKHKDVKRLQSFDEEETDTKPTKSKKRSTK